jgi:hypothetical protein
MRLLLALFLGVLTCLPVLADGGSSAPGIPTTNSNVVLGASDSTVPNGLVLTAGSNITFTPGAGTMTVAASGGGGGTVFTTWTTAGRPGSPTDGQAGPKCGTLPTPHGCQ